MPSNSLAAPPSTASPTALFAQTALLQQILTPLFSFTSTLLLHSFVVRDKSSLLFPTTCALFAKKTGVYPSIQSRSLLASPSRPAKPIKINTYEIAIYKSFRMNTQHPMKDADPERPSGAEGFLHFLWPPRIFARPIRINTYRIAICKSFRMNTYEKRGEGGRGHWPAAISAQRFCGSLLPRLKPTASRTSNPATPEAHPSARSTAGNDPSSYEQCGAPSIPTPRASGTRPCHPRRDADRIADSRLLSASAPPAREAPPPETAHARCARASTQSTSHHSSAASRDDSPRSLSASFYFFGKPSLLSSLPSRRDCTPKVSVGKQYYICVVRPSALNTLFVPLWKIFFFVFLCIFFGLSPFFFLFLYLSVEV